jgi:hypothetical protein
MPLAWKDDVDFEATPAFETTRLLQRQQRRLSSLEMTRPPQRQRCCLKDDDADLEKMPPTLQ